jgi:signal transduction histidine kinase
VGLRERAEALGGGIEAAPLPDGGFRLMLALPSEGQP